MSFLSVCRESGTRASHCDLWLCRSTAWPHLSVYPHTLRLMGVTVHDLHSQSERADKLKETSAIVFEGLFRF